MKESSHNTKFDQIAKSATMNNEPAFLINHEIPLGGQINFFEISVP